MRTLAILLLLFPIVQSLNFVIHLTLIGKSHLDFINSMVNALADKGHNVDVVVALLGEVPIEGKVKKARNVTSFGFPGGSPWSRSQHLNNPFDMTSNVDMRFFYQMTFELGKIGLESGIPVNFMKNGNYDAAIVSDYDYFGYSYAHAAGIKSIMGYASTSLMLGQVMDAGLPNPVSCVGSLMDEAEPTFSLWFKLNQMWRLGRYMLLAHPKVVESTTAVLRQHFGADFPNAGELAKNLDLVFTNGNELTDVPRTITHKIKFIGGIGLRKPKPISEEFESVLRAAKKGVVLVSFGTQVPPKNFNRRIKRTLLNSFKHFPEHTFIWKYTKQEGDEELFEGVTNVELVEWLPQTDLLYDNRTVGFITHSGLNSLHEYTHAGVPVVSIPLFADQFYNARTASRLGIGIHVNKLTVDEEIMTSALRSILYEEKYLQQAKHVAALLAHLPEQAKERFVKWAEFAATHNDLHKQYNLMEADLGIFTYYCLDLALLLIVAAVFLFVVVRKTLSYVFGTGKVKKE